jgi:hypothetical protein
VEACTLYYTHHKRFVKSKKMEELWSCQFNWKRLELYNWDQDFILSSPCSFTFTALAAHNKENLLRMRLMNSVLWKMSTFFIVFCQSTPHTVTFIRSPHRDKKNFENGRDGGEKSVTSSNTTVFVYKELMFQESHL